MSGFEAALIPALTSAGVGIASNKIFGSEPPTQPGQISAVPQPGMQQQQQPMQQVGQQDLATLLLLLSQIANQVPQPGGPQQ